MISANSYIRMFSAVLFLVCSTTIPSASTRECFLGTISTISPLMPLSKDDDQRMANFILLNQLLVKKEYTGSDMVDFQGIIKKDRELVEWNTDGNTLLLFAATVDCIWAIPLLMKFGSDINAQNKKGYTPIHKAVREQHFSMLILLLTAYNKDIQINLPLYELLDTPLHTACRNNWTSGIVVLCQYGADQMAKNKAGRTPEQELAYAQQHNMQAPPSPQSNPFLIPNTSDQSLRKLITTRNAAGPKTGPDYGGLTKGPGSPKNQQSSPKSQLATKSFP